VDWDGFWTAVQQYNAANSRIKDPMRKMVEHRWINEPALNKNYNPQPGCHIV
jgi:hypothetical protein